MFDAAAMGGRREEMLGELAEWMHAAAREAQRRLLDAETPDDFARLTGSLAKLARGVRQSILLQRKLEAERLDKDHRAGEAAAGAEAASDFVPRHVRRVRIRTAIARHVWNELEDEDEAELFREDLNARLDELEMADDFLEASIGDLIERLCRDLGVEPPAATPDAGPLAGPRARSGAGAHDHSGIAPPHRVGAAVLAPDSS
jgi:hypothetical protein